MVVGVEPDLCAPLTRVITNKIRTRPVSVPVQPTQNIRLNRLSESPPTGGGRISHSGLREVE